VQNWIQQSFGRLGQIWDARETMVTAQVPDFFEKKLSVFKNISNILIHFALYRDIICGSI
jgi:hypothetical protein